MNTGLIKLAPICPGQFILLYYISKWHNLKSRKLSIWTVKKIYEAGTVLKKNNPMYNGLCCLIPFDLPQLHSYEQPLLYFFIFYLQFWQKLLIKWQIWEQKNAFTSEWLNEVEERKIKIDDYIFQFSKSSIVKWMQQEDIKSKLTAKDW